MRALPLILAVTVAVLLAAAPAQAATIPVTTIADVVDPADGVTSLREAFVIASSNTEADTIALAPGVEYELTSCFVGSLPHTRPEALTLDGNGSSIYQTCFDRRIVDNTDPASDLTIREVALTGGFNSGVTIHGAAVNASGTTLIEDSQIAFVNAGPGGSVVDAGDGMSGDADLTVVDSEIYSNLGRGFRLSFGSASFTGATIINNSGSGIDLIDGAPLTVTGSEISGNGGPGVSTTGQGDITVSLEDVTIADNDDTGFRCSGCGTVTVTDATITGNGAAAPAGGGGGVSVTYDQDDPTDARAVTVTDSVVTGNTARRRGGGIRIGILDSDAPTAPPGLLTVDGTEVTGNATVGAFDIDGGGIAVETGDLRVTGSTVDGNHAGPPGGLTGSRGGGIYLREHGVLPASPELEVTGSSVSANSANNQGGGIWVLSEGDVEITDSTLAGNHGPSLSGGGIHASGADVALLRSTVDGGAAGTGGGIALVGFSGFPPGSLLLTESTVSRNEATFAASGGGGIFVNVGGGGATATVRNSTVSDNVSANLGGGIMVMQTSRLVLDHATVAGNEGETGANVFVAAGLFTPGRSLLAQSVGADNCSIGGPTASAGFSFADDTSCELGAASDVEGGVSGLGPLGDNGGPTETRVPGASSPAGGLVPEASCLLAADQRGVARPQGDDCDAGAVEFAESAFPAFDDLVTAVDAADPARAVGVLLSVDVRNIERALLRGQRRAACVAVGVLVKHTLAAAAWPLRALTRAEADRILAAAGALRRQAGC